MNELQKIKRWECKEYTNWIKSLDSCVSFIPADDPHHIKGVVYTGTVKPHDLFTIPLTRAEHTELHNRGKINWEKITNTNQAEACIKMISAAIDEGLIEIKWRGKK